MDGINTSYCTSRLVFVFPWSNSAAVSRLCLCRLFIFSTSYFLLVCWTPYLQVSAFFVALLCLVPCFVHHRNSFYSARLICRAFHHMQVTAAKPNSGGYPRKEKGQMTPVCYTNPGTCCCWGIALVCGNGLESNEVCEEDLKIRHQLNYL